MRIVPIRACPLSHSDEHGDQLGHPVMKRDTGGKCPDKRTRLMVLSRPHQFNAPIDATVVRFSTFRTTAKNHKRIIVYDRENYTIIRKTEAIFISRII